MIGGQEEGKETVIHFVGVKNKSDGMELSIRRTVGFAVHIEVA